MNHQKQIRYEFFKVVSRLKEKVFWGPGDYAGAINYIIYCGVEEEELLLDMVYMRPEEAKKQREELDVRQKERETRDSNNSGFPSVGNARTNDSKGSTTIQPSTQGEGGSGEKV